MYTNCFGKGVITIQQYTMNPLSAAVSRKCDDVVGWGSGNKCTSLLLLRVGTCVRLITMEMSTVVK